MRRTVTISDRNAVLAVGVVFTLLVSLIAIGKINDLNGGGGIAEYSVIPSVSANSDQQATGADSVIEYSGSNEVDVRVEPVGCSSCDGACDSPRCGAATDGSCGCGR